jgi:hypothetical protein
LHEKWELSTVNGFEIKMTMKSYAIEIISKSKSVLDVPANQHSQFSPRAKIAHPASYDPDLRPFIFGNKKKDLSVRTFHA